MRDHANKIIKWAENKDAVVWCKGVNGWGRNDKPMWNPVVEYVVVLPEYEDVWQAWLDGELQWRISSDMKWLDWSDRYHEADEPSMSLPPENYRRKSEPLVRYCLVNKKHDAVIRWFTSYEDANAGVPQLNKECYRICKFVEDRGFNDGK